MGRHLVLWDVDHTLIENGGVSKKNYRLAFRQLVGHPPEVDAETHGRTDFSILESFLKAGGVDVVNLTDLDYRSALVEAAQETQEELAVKGYALPGAAEALQRLSTRDDLIQSSLTGNIEPNAFVKLSAFGLDGWIDLSVGGYGSDSRVRSDLVRVAQNKTAKKYDDFDLTVGSTVLIGDTVRDVQAALDGGGRVLAVATGVYSEEELADAGAHQTLTDLSDVDEFESKLDQVIALGPVAID